MCRSLAAILNYIKVHKDNDTYTSNPNHTRNLLEFFRNKEIYSLEHFIIAESGNLKIKTNKLDFSYSYPTYTKKYKDSLLNYIFIPIDINSSIENKVLSQKIEYLKDNIENIKCDYSKKYLESIENHFKKYPSVEDIDKYEDEESIKKYLDEYFSNTFPEEFLEFSTYLLKSFDFSV